MNPIQGYEDKYTISNNGKVYSKPRLDSIGRKIKGKWLSNYIDKGGYETVTLSKNGKHKICKIHQLVAKAYISNYYNYKEINHKDGNKLNNNVDNLEWCTRSQNMKHAHDTGLAINKKGQYHHNTTLTNSDVLEIKKYLKLGTLTQIEISKIYKVSKHVISKIKNGITWSHII